MTSIRVVALLNLAALTFSASAQAAPLPVVRALPGRETIALDGEAYAHDAVPATVAGELPGDRTALVSSPVQGADLAVVELDAGGAIDPSFGHRGVARLPRTHGIFPLQVLSTPDGGLRIVGEAFDGDTELSVLALRPDGTVDPGYGTDGVATIATATDAGGFLPAAIGTDGSVVLSAVAEQPTGGDAWVVQRLTPGGILDSGFGVGGSVTVGSGFGTGAAVAGNGDILAAGALSSGVAVTRLTPSGAFDPTFDSGVPLVVGPGVPSALRLTGDGSVLLGVYNHFGASGVARLTPAGAVDTGFAMAGFASVAAPILGSTGLFVIPGDTAAVFGITAGAHELGAQTFAPDGTGGPVLTLAPRFGGGRFLPSQDTVAPTALLTSALTANSFGPRTTVQRTDGSYLLVGSVSLSTGPTESEQDTGDVAIAAYKADLTPDTAFGTTPTAALSADLDINDHLLLTAFDYGAIHLRVNVSAQGVAQLRVRAAGKIIAQTRTPTLGHGAHVLAVRLNAPGIALLRRRRPLPITASIVARDLLGRSVVARASGRLR